MEKRCESGEPFVYRISGLLVHSDIELPSALTAFSVSLPTDVRIHAGPVPRHLDEPLHSAEYWETKPDLFILRIPGVAEFLIREGRDIIYASAPGSEPEICALYLIGTCFAVLLQQRGALVLHASAVVTYGLATLFCGPSGAGKSTTAAMLSRRGYSVLNDDVCCVSLGAGGICEVCPDGRMLKLWSASLEQLDWNRDAARAVHRDIEKYFCAPPSSDSSPRPVGVVYILREAPPGEAPSVCRLRPLEAMIELKRNAYRPMLIAAMQLESAYFKASAALQRGAGVYLLSRLLDFDAADQFLDMLETHWATLNSENVRSAKR
jgi:hypothetical protein